MVGAAAHLDVGGHAALRPVGGPDRGRRSRAVGGPRGAATPRAPRATPVDEVAARAVAHGEDRRAGRRARPASSPASTASTRVTTWRAAYPSAAASSSAAETAVVAPSRRSHGGGERGRPTPGVGDEQRAGEGVVAGRGETPAPAEQPANVRLRVRCEDGIPDAVGQPSLAGTASPRVAPVTSWLHDPPADARATRAGRQVRAATRSSRGSTTRRRPTTTGHPGDTPDQRAGAAGEPERGRNRHGIRGDDGQHVTGDVEVEAEPVGRQHRAPPRRAVHQPGAQARHRDRHSGPPGAGRRHEPTLARGLQ